MTDFQEAAAAMEEKATELEEQAARLREAARMMLGQDPNGDAPREPTFRGFTRKEVAEVRRAYRAGGVLQRELAEANEVSTAVISRMVRSDPKLRRVSA